MQTVVSSTSSADPETLSSLLHSPNVILKLAALTFVSLVPILARDKLKSLITRAPEHEAESKRAMTKDAQSKRWWYKHWRARKESVEVVEMDVKGEKPSDTTTS
jgi:hypothetical protein